MSEGKNNTQQQAAPDPERWKQSVASAQKVVAAQNAADSLKQKAKIAMDPVKRKQYLQEAYQKEVEAHGESKFAKRLQSGPWQGGGAGAGIGAGVSMGLGTTVGTLVTGVAAVPTVLVGGLVGAGVGAIHGPWITLGGDKKGKKPMSDEEKRAEAMKEAEKLDDAVERGATTVPQPPSDLETGDAPAPKRKPKKLEVRSGKESSPQPPEKRRPRKLDTRSSSASVA